MKNHIYKGKTHTNSGIISDIIDFRLNKYILGINYQVLIS